MSMTLAMLLELLDEKSISLFLDLEYSEIGEFNEQDKRMVDNNRNIFREET